MTGLASGLMLAADPAFELPSIDYGAILPMMIVFGGALLSLAVEAFVSRPARSQTQRVVSLLTLVAALVAVGVQWSLHEPGATAGGALVIDAPTLFMQGLLIFLAIAALLTFFDATHGETAAFAAAASAVPGSPDEDTTRKLGWVQTEIYPLMLFSVGGMLMFPASGDLLTMFIALEVLSLPLYLLAGLARRRRLLSQEASLKYFLLGAFSSAVFLYGAALLYGYAGSVRLSELNAAATEGTGPDALLMGGMAMVAIGLLFKVGAVPFHQWTPDVYQGAPTPVTGFMAAGTKVAALGALLRFLYVAMPGIRWNWLPVLWIVAGLTMVIGCVVAVVQADVKRMLAYSSIAHAGFILVGVLAMDRQGISSVLFYLVAYGFTTVGAFAMLTLVRTSDGGAIGGEASALSAWAGLARQAPWVAGVFTLFLLALAGLPLTSGFASKFAVFSAAVAHGGPWGAWLAVVGVLSSSVAFFFYARVIVLMYFSEPSSTEAATVIDPAISTTVAITIGVAVTLILGVLPTPVLDLASQATVFLP